MATNLNTAVGEVTTTSNTSSTTVSGLPFQPKVVILMGKDAGAAFYIGFSDGTNHRYVLWAGQNGVSTTNVGTRTSTTKAVPLNVTITTGTISVAFEGTVTMNSDGFTINWGSNQTLLIPIEYIALGGSDISNVAIGTNTMPTVTGNKATTGLGFTPNFVMLTSGSSTAAGSAVNAQMSYGAAISTSARFSHALAVVNGQTMAANVNGVSWQRTDACLIGLSTAAAADYVADFVSFDSGTGFTINFSDAAPSAFQFFYLAIGGTNLNWDINTGIRPTGASAQSRTGLSFAPDFVFWSESSVTTLNSITSNATLSFGGGKASGSGNSAYAGHNDSINTAFAGIAGTGGVVLRDIVSSVLAAGTTTASVTSLNSDGWTITWAGTGSADQISSISVAGTTAIDTSVFAAAKQQGQTQPVLEKYQIIPY